MNSCLKRTKNYERNWKPETFEKVGIKDERQITTLGGQKMYSLLLPLLPFPPSGNWRGKLQERTPVQL
jgi:hypothetical protein